MQPALGVSSGCVRLRNASDARAVARSDAGSPSDTRKTADSRISPDVCSRLRSYPNAIVGDAHVRSAAEQGDRHVRAARDAQRVDDLVAAARLDQIVGRPADAERRERREPHVPSDARLAEPRAERVVERRHACRASTAISARSCAISAAIASRIVQTTNAIVSPGPSCPATGMSALMTVAIFG